MEINCTEYVTTFTEVEVWSEVKKMNRHDFSNKMQLASYRSKIPYSCGSTPLRQSCVFDNKLWFSWDRKSLSVRFDEFSVMTKLENVLDFTGTENELSLLIAPNTIVRITRLASGRFICTFIK